MHMHNDAVYNYTARIYSFLNAISPHSAPEMPLLLGLCSAGALTLDCCYLIQKGDLWNNTSIIGRGDLLGCSVDSAGFSASYESQHYLIVDEGVRMRLHTCTGAVRNGLWALHTTL